MGAFFYLSKNAALDVKHILLKARHHFEHTGFASPITFESDKYVVDYYPKIANISKNHLALDNSDFVFSVGTFLYRGLIGAPALKLFFEQADMLAELRQCRGHFALLARKNGKTWLLRDTLGLQDVFIAHDGLCFTSSFLAAAVTSPKCTVGVQEVYEYVFAGVSLGSRTPIAEVRRLQSFERALVDQSPPRVVAERANICPEEDQGGFSHQVQSNLNELVQYTSNLANLFGSNIRLALSGGYDSRLLLALFRRSGITTSLFVYGTEQDGDVQIAKTIAQTEGINLRHINKAKFNVVPLEKFPEVVHSTFLTEDALGSGGIFFGPAEQVARFWRSENGALHVNGGGGEIFRNFFYLFDRSISVQEFVWCFYSQFDPRQCSERFDSRTYERNVAEKALAIFGSESRLLSRRQVECLYPYFRCISWFGRENSINSRYGYSLLPFLDTRVVERALKIPICFKHFGNFESALIRAADAELATHMSNYGHTFENVAPPAAVGRWLLTYLRPPWLRRYTFRIKSHLQKPPARSLFLSDLYLAKVIDTTFPYMSQYFRIGSVNSAEHFARICTLEYLFAHLRAQ